MQDVLDAVQAAGVSDSVIEGLRREWGGQSCYIRSARRDIQRQIRQAEGSNRELAERFGLHRNSIIRLRRGVTSS